MLMQHQTAYLKLDGLTAPVLMRVDERFLSALPAVFANWPYTLLSTPPEPPFATVDVCDAGYEIHSPFLDRAILHRDPLNALCSLVVEISWARLRQEPELLCLHGGAVAFSGRLVLFPATRRAGKSTLTVALAAAGKTVFTDDFLPLRIAPDGVICGLSSGISPRLRLPVPRQFGPRARTYIRSRSHIANRQYQYVAPQGHELAHFNDAAPIGALVFLERSDGAAAVLEPVSAAETLKSLIIQNFARALNAKAILQMLAAIAKGAPAYRLRYDAVEPAIALLADSFTEWDSPAPVFDRDPAETPFTSALDIPPKVESIDITTGQFLQAPDIAEVITDGQRFLTGRNGKSIHYLNDGATMIWRLLEDPASLAETIGMLRAVFPEQPPKGIETDVIATFTSFAKNGLLIQAGDICQTPRNQADLPRNT